MESAQNMSLYQLCCRAIEKELVNPEELWTTKAAVKLHDKFKGYGGYTIQEVFTTMKYVIEEWVEEQTIIIQPHFGKIPKPKKTKPTHAQYFHSKTE